MFAIDHRGVHLFAAPYTKRPVLADEIEAAPASDNGGEVADWSNPNASRGSGSGIGAPLLL